MYDNNTSYERVIEEIEDENIQHAQRCQRYVYEEDAENLENERECYVIDGDYVVEEGERCIEYDDFVSNKEACLYNYVNWLFLSSKKYSESGVCYKEDLLSTRYKQAVLHQNDEYDEDEEDFLEEDAERYFEQQQQDNTEKVYEYTTRMEYVHLLSALHDIVVDSCGDNDDVCDNMVELLTYMVQPREFVAKFGSLLGIDTNTRRKADEAANNVAMMVCRMFNSDISQRNMMRDINDDEQQHRKEKEKKVQQIMALRINILCYLIILGDECNRMFASDLIHLVENDVELCEVMSYMCVDLNSAVDSKENIPVNVSLAKLLKLVSI